jgi:hypothetical protein
VTTTIARTGPNYPASSREAADRVRPSATATAGKLLAWFERNKGAWTGHEACEYLGIDYTTSYADARLADLVVGGWLRKPLEPGSGDQLVRPCTCRKCAGRRRMSVYEVRPERDEQVGLGI